MVSNLQERDEGFVSDNNCFQFVKSKNGQFVIVHEIQTGGLI